MKVNRYLVFCHLWAIAGFSEWVRWSWSETTWGWILVVHSTFLFLFPSSVLALAVFACVQIWFTIMAANSPWNHGLFMAVVNVGILISIIHILLQERGQQRPCTGTSTQQMIMETFAPAVRLSLIILYLFTFIHKVNVDFLNPDVSCAGVVLQWLGNIYPGLPTDRWMIVVSIWATLFVELGVPLLLCFRRTIYAGLAIGFGFHLFLSQDGALFGFAAMIFAVYFLFLPSSFIDSLNERIERLSERVGLKRIHRGTSALFLIGVIGCGVAAHRFLGWGVFFAGRNVWDLWLLGSLFLAGPVFLKLYRHPPIHQLLPGWKPLLILPGFVFLNGLCPYLGLKTETSWAMYSNLRTEVHWNHLVLPEHLKVFPFQDDRVEIVDSSRSSLSRFAPEKQVQLTFFEFRRYCSNIKGDFEIHYRRNGNEGWVARRNGVSTDPDLTEPHPWLLSKLLRFRPVDVGPHATCRH